MPAIKKIASLPELSMFHNLILKANAAANEHYIETGATSAIDKIKSLMKSDCITVMAPNNDGLFRFAGTFGYHGSDNGQAVKAIVHGLFQQTKNASPGMLFQFLKGHVAFKNASLEKLEGSVKSFFDFGDEADGGAGTDRISGGGGSDIVKGGKNDDIVAGGEGDDIVHGNRGADTLYGNGGDDLLADAQGASTLTGGRGNDVLKGGEAADTFVFAPGSGQDRIVDFGYGKDVIDLTAYGLDGRKDLAISQAGAATLIGMGTGDTIQLDKFLAGDLNAGDFLF